MAQRCEVPPFALAALRFFFAAVPLALLGGLLSPMQALGVGLMLAGVIVNVYGRRIA